MYELEKWNNAKTAIAECKTVDEVKHIRDKAEALRMYAKQAGESLQVQNDIAEIKIRAERKAGELLRDMPKATPGVKPNSVTPCNRIETTLEDIGIEKHQSSRWQQTAAIPEKDFEEHIIKTKQEGELTSASVLRLASGLKHTEKMAGIRDPENLPEGKYNVIYADPPWPVGSIVMDKWESPIDDKYPTMTIQEIKDLKIQDISSENCALFLWTTHTFLHEAFHVMEAWGFKYFCLITWDKGGGWTQAGFHKRTELLLYGYKGVMNIEAGGAAIPTIIAEKKAEHSKKPDSIRNLIAGKTPEPRIELFARSRHEGWTAWGNEA